MLVKAERNSGVEFDAGVLVYVKTVVTTRLSNVHVKDRMAAAYWS